MTELMKRYEAETGPEEGVMAMTELTEALEETSEALEFALSRLGCCGHGDGKGRKADVDDYGGMELCARNKELLKNISSNNIPDVTEAKAAAYDRIMSGGKKTLKEWANIFGMPVAVDQNGEVACFGHVPVMCHNNGEGIWTNSPEHFGEGVYLLPVHLIDFDGNWKYSLTLPDGWEEAE